jgi:uncharacterized protein YwqG
MAIRAEEILRVLDSNEFLWFYDYQSVLSAGRLRAYRSDKDWLLIIEGLGVKWIPSDRQFWSKHWVASYGSGVRRQGPSSVGFGRLRIYSTHKEPIAAEISLGDDEFEVDRKALARAVTARKGTHTAWVQTILAAQEQALARWGRDRVFEDELSLLSEFATDDWERRERGEPPTFRPLLVLDEWNHPDIRSGERPGASPTFQMIAQALAKEDPKLYKPKLKPNTFAAAWWKRYEPGFEAMVEAVIEKQEAGAKAKKDAEKAELKAKEAARLASIDAKLYPKTTKGELEPNFATWIRNSSLKNKATVLSLVRPAIAGRKKKGKAAKGGSRFGGDPDLPAELDWPRWKDKPQTFVAQIALDELPRRKGLLGLPEKGHLWFFYGYDCDEDAMFPYGDDDSEQGAAVVLHSESSKLAPRKSPTGVKKLPVEPLEFAVVSSVPTSEHPAWKRVKTKRPDFLGKALRAYDVRPPRYQIGGYAEPMQEDVTASVARTMGVPKEAEALQLLFQALDAFGEVSVWWLIHESDLAAGNFDEAFFCAQAT